MQACPKFHPASRAASLSAALCASLAAALVLTGAPRVAQAESSFATATATGFNASARLDFQITVPQVLYLQIGAGPASGMAANSTVSLLSFTVPANALGTGSAIAGDATAGDRGNGVVSVRIKGNVGDLHLSLSTTGNLTNPALGSTIPWDEIAVSAAASGAGGAAALQHPAWNNGTVTIPASNTVVDLASDWTFRYLNNQVVGAGTYGGAGINNGRVTYTLTQP